jgi:ABC transport system ATP-binding/permease protein
MQLFAIMASINKETVHVLARNFVESYLTRQFSQRLAEKYLLVFDEYSAAFNAIESRVKGKTIASLSVKILGICTRINEELHIQYRFQILLSLVQFAKYFEDSSASASGFTNAITDAVKTVSDGLQIKPEEYANCHAFIVDKFYKVPDKESLLVISDDSNFMFSEIRHLHKNGLPGQIFVLNIRRADIYLLQYAGKEKLEINGKYIFPRHVYLLPKGSSVKGAEMAPIYYSDVVSGFMHSGVGDQVDFLAKDVEFRFRNSANGIHKFSFQGKSGQLVGIMGGSGTGKSTLLKVLSGSLKLDAGNIFINGYNIAEKNRELDGMIGFIPQDDLLMEELSVYQNLYFNAKLCLDGCSREELDEKVIRTLQELGLYEARDLKVGSPLNKFISGGQRKRLNIALELIREPYILFVDEPTSGLSSTDSEIVMQLLKEQAMKGKLIMVNIHQPSSDLFKMFDHLIVMDKGGYPVYSGNPVEGIIYFKKLVDRVDAAESECEYCGNANPEDILQVIETHDINELGEFSDKRKKGPEEWYGHYIEKIQSRQSLSLEKSEVPENLFRIPESLKQFLIFFKRNFLSKLADKQFLAISLIVAPILAVILGYFTKFVSGSPEDPHAYIFSQNENLPAYLFMSVIVALFLGLILSAEEIIRDRKILERESFLKLSRTAYLLSKLSLLFILSAIQMLLFVWIGNAILGIKGMTFSYWLILFSTSCFANILGLNISDGLKSVVAIYVVVPFLLVPQILLAGVIVKFDKLHYMVASHESVPFVGDIMASRWAYEALAVNQFMNNRYQRHFSELNMRESNITYDLSYLAPTLIQKVGDLRNLMNSAPDDEKIPENIIGIREAFEFITLTRPFPLLESLTPEAYTPLVADSAISWLQDYRTRLSDIREKLAYEKDALYNELMDVSGGTSELINFKRQYHNEQLADIVLNSMDLHKITEVGGKLIRKMEPVYQYPSMHNGRAHFFASVKILGGLYIPTLLFNVGILWLMTLIFYLSLQFGLLRKAIDFSGELQNRKRKS